MYLVSGIYQIQCDQMFNERVTISIQHAAIIESEDDRNHFKLFAAKCSEGPPYHFIPLDHGQFYSEHCTIGVRKFSLFAAGSIDRVPNQRYILQVFYRLRQLDISWDMTTVVVKDEPITVQVCHMYCKLMTHVLN